MCGRYVSPDEATIEREFNLVRTEWRFPANFNIPPSSAVPAIRARGAGPETIVRHVAGYLRGEQSAGRISRSIGM